MPKYFTHLDQTNKPGNALHRAAEELLKKESNRLIDDRDRFLQDLKTKIEALNTAFPRCTPLHFSTCGMLGNNVNIYLGGFTVSFKVYQVKEDADA